MSIYSYNALMLNIDSVATSFAFLIANILIMRLILALNRQSSPKPSPPPPPEKSPLVKPLHSADILKLEFEYARLTASEAMRDRHTMVNFYLLAFGVISTGVLTILSREADLSQSIGTLLLWILCGVGWLYFLKIIRLRQAWHDSARAMGQIKEFFIQHDEHFDAEELRPAFHWQAHTLPSPDKPWTVFFYSAVLIAVLDSMAYVLGAAMLDISLSLNIPPVDLGFYLIFGIGFLAFHIWLYFAFLRNR
jgi:Na+-transporting methylmalonyl-CoA/oxaloacetate decarboxylase gamma subunit